MRVRSARGGHGITWRRSHGAWHASGPSGPGSLALAR
jgi:hypothetical protein